MGWYEKKPPPNLAPPVPTAREVRMPKESKRKRSNRMASSARCGEALKSKELGKESGEGEVKDSPMGSGEALTAKELGKESGKDEVKDNLVGGGEALKGEELGKESGNGKVKNNPVGGGEVSRVRNWGRNRGRVKSRIIRWVKGVRNIRWYH